MSRYIPIVLMLCLSLAGCRHGEIPPVDSSVAEPSVSEPAPDSSAPEEMPSRDTIDPLEEAAKVSAREYSDSQAAETPVAEPVVEHPEATLPVQTPDSTPQTNLEVGRTPPAPDPSMADGANKQQDALTVRTTRLESELLSLINSERSQRGLEALGVEESMQFAAHIRAQEALESLSHTRPDNSLYYTAFDEAGFTYAGKWHGENLAIVQLESGEPDDESIAQALFAQWKASPGHERNMFSENFVQTGIGVYVETVGEQLHVGSAQLFASL